MATPDGEPGCFNISQFRCSGGGHAVSLLVSGHKLSGREPSPLPVATERGSNSATNGKAPLHRSGEGLGRGLYEPDPELRDTEQIPLLEPGGVAGFIEREVWPHVPDAWVDPASERIGYEISFTRYFYKPQPLRTLDEIRADILALEAETDGLLVDILT